MHRSSMELSKQTKIDKYEIVSEFKIIQVREVTEIIEDGTVISSSYNRYMVTPATDTSKLPKEIQDMAALLHTEEIKKAFNSSNT